MKQIDVALVSEIILACCVLHDICKVHGDGCLPYWDEERVRIEEQEGLEQPQAHDNATSSATGIRKSLMILLSL